MEFYTAPRPVQHLEAGDVYLVSLTGGVRETRRVLGVMQHTPLGGALLEVVAPNGDVFRSHMDGRVDVVHEGSLV